MSAIKEHYHDEIEKGQREAAKLPTVEMINDMIEQIAISNLNQDEPIQVEPAKHKWRSAKRFQYLIISKCIHCGCLRQKIDLHGIKYLYDPFGIKTTVEPICKGKC